MLHDTLGSPVPFDDHATSVSLPDWADVVDYEEGHLRVTSIMKMGYPRFKIHSSVEALAYYMKNRKFPDQKLLSAFIFPTRHVAERFLQFMTHVRLVDSFSLIF